YFLHKIEKKFSNQNFLYRWKEAECSLKITITDQAKYQELKNNLSEVVQTIFTRFNALCLIQRGR
ncbi:Uncharacterized protein FWK35_00019533, partial [Aphis craccivora]